MVSAWRNFKNIFSRPLFTIIFRPEMLKFHPYSILTGETMVGFVIYCVLSTILKKTMLTYLCNKIQIYSLKQILMYFFTNLWVHTNIYSKIILCFKLKPWSLEKIRLKLILIVQAVLKFRAAQIIYVKKQKQKTIIEKLKVINSC